MLTENPGFCHWCTFHLYKLFQIHEVSHASKIFPASLGYATGLSFHCQGSWSRPSVNWPKWRWVSAAGSSSGCTSNSPKLSYSTPHLEIFPFLQSAHHHSILQTVKTRDKTLEGLPKREHADRGGKPHLLCLTLSDPRIYQFLGLSRVTSHWQCNNWTMFVEAFKYRERKQILK